ncbi:MAG: hypothetical protein QHH02_07740, partial [Syntrophomonadaceae bacterium]|nr:hypothetical protein [Syntrophomonadaceae bacterium]
GSEEIDEKFTKKRMIDFGRELGKFGVEGMRVRYSYVPLPVYKKAAGGPGGETGKHRGRPADSDVVDAEFEEK